tara:strand:+ start:22 stop:639 length:618 start_codon:yes stop_codon:yes gene_type:complete
MKNFVLTLITFFAFALASAQTLEIGDRAPLSDVQMINYDGRTFSIDDVKGKNGALVIFTCNNCPFVVGRGDTEGWEGRYNGIFEFAESNGVGSILVNSNSAFRRNQDNISAMKNRARDMNYTAPYVVDEMSQLANAFYAKTTPHVFLFDSGLSLIYKGAIDDNVDSAKDVEKHFLRDAIERHGAGKKVRKSVTAPLGCSIKREKS